MLKLWRFLALSWILGGGYVLVQHKPMWFHWIGLSRMDIFNRDSLQATQWRIVYFHGETLLPMMDYQGRNLAWMDDENMKYRTYLGAAFSLGPPGKLTRSLPRSWRRVSPLFLRPVLYDFCQRPPGSHVYSVDFLHAHSSEVELRLEWTLHESERVRCPPQTYGWAMRRIDSAVRPAAHVGQTLSLNPDGTWPHSAPRPAPGSATPRPAPR